MPDLRCPHGEVFPYASAAEAAAHGLCGFCCTPYQRGGYREHCAESPSHVGEKLNRREDARLERRLARAGYSLTSFAGR